MRQATEFAYLYQLITVLLSRHHVFRWLTLRETPIANHAVGLLANPHRPTAAK